MNGTQKAPDNAAPTPSDEHLLDAFEKVLDCFFYGDGASYERNDYRESVVGAYKAALGRRAQASEAAQQHVTRDDLLRRLAALPNQTIEKIRWAAVEGVNDSNEGRRKFAEGIVIELTQPYHPQPRSSAVFEAPNPCDELSKSALDLAHALVADAEDWRDEAVGGELVDNLDWEYTVRLERQAADLISTLVRRLSDKGSAQ